ncbi:hypothetical protein [Allochromatium vinosum]|uniref:Uncharacterized protein n=1 Tax=Allochromatium vinosum (strain ATCC 17899 / DSM 180 / NBRC 103801 / NCIMB 10441 / D) TaxID=572477 RepID=D3RW41_ALLVD|nr:hypothetical protein [Allochromatium vinosum]ADC64053.1 hypothetical protein Alvin_3155 [Allochromatium vinosum DSM 180]
MDHERARTIVANLPEIMATGDFDQIWEAFDALLQLDADAIYVCAEEVMARISLAERSREFEGEELRASLMLEVFQGSVIDYCREKCPHCDASVGHGIPSWFDSNATRIATINRNILEAALPGAGTLEDIDPRLDFEYLDADQNAMLSVTWRAIEMRIETLLSVSGYAES